jgi:hypothetical protein
MKFSMMLGKTVLLFLLAATIVLGDGPKPEKVIVKGYVLDSACAFTKGLEKPVSRDCALLCAKNGSPLVILSDDGIVYLPISEAPPPAVGQNEKLLPFAGNKVTITGKAYDRRGSRAIVIEKIEPVAAAK